MQRVGAEGSLDSRYMLIGEAPGQHELMRGQPFVGPAGKELEKLMHSAGILRRECYITNVIKEFPGRELDSFIENKGKGKFFVSDRYKHYEEELCAEIADCSADVVIPLGWVALYATTRYGNIEKRRGSIMSDPRFPGKTIVPTIHPSKIFRDLERSNVDKKKGLNGYLCSYAILNDLLRAKHQALTGDPLPQRNLRIKPTFYEAMEYIEQCEGLSAVGFDIETMKTRSIGKFTDWEMSCLALAISPDDCMSIPFIDRNRDDYFSVSRERELWRALARLLESTKVAKIIQNASFDASFILRKHKVLINNIDDTLIAAAILTPDFPYGLDFLTSIYTREPYYKDEGKQHSAFFKDAETFWRYNAKDAAVLMEIFPQQIAELKEQRNLETYEQTKRLLHPLLFIEAKGLRTDKPGMEKASIAILAEAQQKVEDFKAYVKADINPLSPKQVQEYFYITKRVKPILKDRKITADKDALKKLYKLGHPEAKMILDIRGLLKLRSTYMEMTLDEDNRIRSAMAPVTVTGRLNSSQNLFGTGGNIQNLPKLFRKYIIADPGCLCYEPDYTQAENRLVAIIAPEPLMAEAFATGRDVHSLTGSLVSGLSYEEVYRQNKEGITCQIAAGDKTWRYWGKQANHALNYGLGADKFSKRYEIPLEDAQEIVAMYHKAYPGIRQYHSWIQFKLKEDRVLTNVLGRKRKFLDKMGPDLFEAAYAFIPQSTVGKMINDHGLLPVYYEQDLFAPVEVLNQVHDALWFQMSYERWCLQAHAACLLALKRYMEQPLEWKGEQFSIPVDFKMGLNFGEMLELNTNCSLEELTSQIESGLKQLVA